jgi:hypothetical protein
MEQMDAAAVAAWFADTLKLPQYAAAITEHEIDGDVLLELEKRDNLSELNITNVIHQAKVRGALAKLGRKRAADSRVKRRRTVGAEADEVTPGPAAAGAAIAGEGGLDQAGFQQAAAQLDLAAAAEATPVFVAQSTEHGQHFYVSKPSENLMCPLCLEAVAERPAALRCGHFFCRGCLLMALVADRRCPTCRAAAGGAADADLETLVIPAHAVASLVDELPVRCPRGVVQLQASGRRLSHFAAHRSFSIYGDFLHEMQWLAVKWLYGQWLQAADGGADQDDWVVAPGGCGVVVPREQLAAHVASCPLEPVGCTQAQHGCGWRGLRSSLALHTGACWYEQGREYVARSEAAVQKLRTEVTILRTAMAGAEAWERARARGELGIEINGLPASHARFNTVYKRTGVMVGGQPVFVAGERCHFFYHPRRDKWYVDKEEFNAHDPPSFLGGCIASIDAGGGSVPIGTRTWRVVRVADLGWSEVEVTVCEVV